MRSFPAVAYSLLFLTFILLAVYASGFIPQQFDRTLLDLVRSWQSPLLDIPMYTIRFLGETWPSLILAAGAAIWLGLKKGWREALGFLAALVAVSIASAMVKGIIDRIRPDGEHFSFVSGHTAYFTVFCGFLFFRLKALVFTRRWLIFWRCVLGLLLLLTGLSRLYLGLHWPTDVMGGLLLGILILVPVLWRIECREPVAT